MKNSILKKIYQEKWTTFSEQLNQIIKDKTKEEKPTNPLLIYIDEENYINADIKIMIFGQETNDWEGNFQNNIDIALETYDDFFNSNDCYTYGGQFWNGFNRFLSLIQEKYADKKVSSIWNNVIKVGNSGRNKNYPPEYIYNIEKENFNIIKDEIDILKPDIIIFMSGPNYDLEIKNSLYGVEFRQLSQKFSERQISKLNYKNHNNIYRTYHPNYLWRNNINSYFEEIINDISL